MLVSTLPNHSFYAEVGKALSMCRILTTKTIIFLFETILFAVSVFIKGFVDVCYTKWWYRFHLFGNVSKSLTLQTVIYVYKTYQGFNSTETNLNKVTNNVTVNKVYDWYRKAGVGKLRTGSGILREILRSPIFF